MNSNKVNRYVYYTDKDMNDEETLNYQKSCVVDIFVNLFPTQNSIIVYNQFKNDIDGHVTGNNVTSMETQLNKYINASKLKEANETTTLEDRFALYLDAAKKINDFIICNCELLGDGNEDNTIPKIIEFLETIMEHLDYNDVTKFYQKWYSIAFNLEEENNDGIK